MATTKGKTSRAKATMTKPKPKTAEAPSRPIEPGDVVLVSGNLAAPQLGYDVMIITEGPVEGRHTYPYNARSHAKPNGGQFKLGKQNIAKRIGRVNLEVFLAAVPKPQLPAAQHTGNPHLDGKKPGDKIQIRVRRGRSVVTEEATFNGMDWRKQKYPVLFKDNQGRRRCGMINVVIG